MERTAIDRLEPGDRRIRAVVRPERAIVPRVQERPTCARCDGEVDLDDAWTVLHGPHDGTEPDRLLACHACGSALMPFRLVLHLGRLREEVRRSIGRVRDQAPVPRTVRGVAEVVLGLARARSPEPEHRMTIRAADVIGLAHMLGTTRTHLALRLRDAGVLLGVDGSVPHEDCPPT